MLAVHPLEQIDVFFARYQQVEILSSQRVEQARAEGIRKFFFVQTAERFEILALIGTGACSRAMG